ncbi:MAG: DMT family transporter [Granulosicoccaceae bacterium]
MNALLYFLTWLSWGGSWLAIKWQEGAVPVTQSIAYRFALAGIILFLALMVLRRLQRCRAIDHVFFLLQGICLYSFNFVAFYNATAYISSGLVAVVMSTVILLNAFLGSWVWRQEPSRYLWVAAPLGMAGLVLLFWQDLAGGLARSTAMGVALSLLGSLSFSCGNMLSIRQGRAGIDTLSSNAWAMIYGCLLMLAASVLQGQSFQLDTSAKYLGGLLYLAFIASVLAFPVYLTLVARIGASSAAYVLVATPVLALGLSTVFEGYQWQETGIAGVVMIVLGNCLVLMPASISARIAARGRRWLKSEN